MKPTRSIGFDGGGSMEGKNGAFVGGWSYLRRSSVTADSELAR